MLREGVHEMAHAKQRHQPSIDETVEHLREKLINSGVRLGQRERAEILRAIRSLTGKTLSDDSAAMIRDMRDKA
jgi:hypothetical protein